MMYRWLTILFLAALVAEAAPACAGEVDRYLPVDSEVVITVKVKELGDTPVFKQNLLVPARDALKSLEELQKGLDDIGFDPFTDLDRVILAGPGGAAADKIMIVGYGTFDLDKFKTRAEEAAKDNPDHLKIEKVKIGTEERVIYEAHLPDADSATYISLPNKTTVLISHNKDYVLEALKNVDPRNKVQLKNKVLHTAVEQVNPRQTITLAASGAGLGRFELPEGLLKAAGKMEAIAGGITFGDDIRVELVMQCGNETQAREVVRNINDSVTAGILFLSVLARKEESYTPLVEVVKSVRANQKDKTATVTLKGEISSDLLGKLLKGL